MSRVRFYVLFLKMFIVPACNYSGARCVEHSKGRGIPVMKKIAFVMFIFMLVIPLRPASVAALSCAELPTVEDGINKYDGVVVAEVIKVDEKKKGNLITLAIESSFKGITEKKLTIEEDKVWGSLNGPSAVGSKYLFFLNQRDDDAGWENPLCSPSKPVAGVTAEELEFLSARELELTPQEATVKTKSLGKIPVAYTIAGLTAAGLIVSGICIYLLVQKNKR
ncbi:hypothetical protein D3C76_100540 [compost metagenome]